MLVKTWDGFIDTDAQMDFEKIYCESSEDWWYL